jgi:hypothetical protein
MLYMSSYPLIAVGLWGLGTRRRLSQASSAVAAALVTGMVVFVSWVFLVLPGPQGAGTEAIGRVVAWGYPVLDLLLVALLIRACITERGLPGTYALFGTALILWLAADVAYAIDGFGTAYVPGDWIDAMWLLSYAAFGASTLHPSAWGEGAEDREIHVAGKGHLHDVRLGDVMRWSGRLLLILSAAAMLAAAAWRQPGMVIVGGTYGTTGGVLCLVGASRRQTTRTIPKLRRSGLRPAA